ncbi:unnamed protein product [Polarella glacialis]|uniref:CCHC-type domain-containing protein n=1 Tax=Polarella glacialis TaxID=89957 RepID=A0A813KEI6_POLGL|nr:unnamed protein product [Polarella glacialis]
MAGRIIYRILAALCNGKAKVAVRSVGDEDGWEAWRILSQTYRPNVEDRHVAMLDGLLNPDWKDVPPKDFWEEFLKWEHAVTDYEQQSGDQMADRRYAPEQVADKIRSLDIGKDYRRLREKLQYWLVRLVRYDHAGLPLGQEEPPQHRLQDEPRPVHQPADPMDLFTAFGKGKGKGKQKGKGKSKGKPFTGTCYLCGRQGHRGMECPWAMRTAPAGDEAEEEVSEDYWGPQCWTCWGYGHRAAHCGNNRVPVSYVDFGGDDEAVRGTLGRHLSAVYQGVPQEVCAENPAGEDEDPSDEEFGDGPSKKELGSVRRRILEI